jgi:hypothetical protein
MHRGIKQMDAEIDRRTAISVQFCKAFEKAIQLVPSEENVRIWTECCRMTLEEMADTADEARDLAVSFTTIADLLEHTIMPEDWRCAHGEKAPAVQ